jgi:hypothetical protein
METENSGVLEAYVKDPIPRPLGVIMWAVYQIAGRNFIEFGRCNLLVSKTLQIADSRPEKWVATGMFVDGKEVIVKRDQFLEVLRRYV